MHNLRFAFFCLAAVIALNSPSVDAGASVDAFAGSSPNPWHGRCLSRRLRIAAYEYEVASGYANKDRGVGWLNWISGHHELFRHRPNEALANTCTAARYRRHDRAERRSPFLH